ncbi:MAG: ABC transporter ATP-binding protein [Chitinophagales bacterium]
MTSISIHNISKSFGKTKALSDIQFSVEEGQLFGLIGPDGAGKSTLFKILTTLLIPDEGRAEVVGFDTVKDFKKIRKIIGYMPGKFSLYPDLSVQENLQFFATIFGTRIEANYHLIEDIYEQLVPFKKRRAGKLSGGMKQKLALCCALIHKPEVLFLDEPTTGVDSVSRAEFWEMLKRLKQQGITILVSTPYMDEAALCERIALIQTGNILQIDTPENITNSYQKPLFAVRSADFYQLLKDLRDAPFAERVEPFGEYLHLTTKNFAIKSEIEAFLTSKGHKEVELKEAKATIEDVFLDLM